MVVVEHLIQCSADPNVTGACLFHGVEQVVSNCDQAGIMELHSVLRVRVGTSTW